MAQKEVILKDLYILYEIDSSNNIIFVNDAFCQISNYKKSEILGIPHHKIQHIDNSTFTLTDLKESITNKGFWEGILKYETKDGDFYWLHTIVLKKGEKNRQQLLYLGLKPTKDEIKEVELNNSNRQKKDNIKNLVVWSDSLSVNYAPIDAHHKNLVNLLNRLNKATLGGRDRKEIDKILNELAEYTVYHFGYEEEQMKKNNYQNFDKHKAEHIAFIDQVTKFIKQFKDGEVHVDENTLEFLKKWLSNHIMKTDKELGGFLSPTKKK